MDARQAAVLCARVLDDKLARDIVILDLRDRADIADYFVVCTGINERQIRALAEELDCAASQESLPRLGTEGTADAKWVLLDLGDVIVHIFTQEARSFYDLEMLWGDSPKVPWEPEADSAPRA